jgi:hypothetical protein
MTGARLLRELRESLETDLERLLPHDAKRDRLARDLEDRVLR